MVWYQNLDKWMDAYLPDLAVLREEPLSAHSSFRIGGSARRMAFPKTTEQLVLLMSYAKECGACPLVIGNGTNMLFPDGGLDRLVVNTRDMNEIEVKGRVIRAGAGANLATLANRACAESLTGLEFAHGIPGSVGGAICMNGGAYGGEMKDVVQSVAVLFDDGIRYLKSEEMEFSYRHSILTDHPEAVVLYADFALEKGDSTAIRGRMEELMAKRKASQPLEYPSAGSTFKRPAGYFAGALIEQAGMKGFSVGDAQVSEKHAGFVINRGHATGAEVRQLIARVQERVMAHSGVMLEPEVKIID